MRGMEATRRGFLRGSAVLAAAAVVAACGGGGGASGPSLTASGSGEETVSPGRYDLHYTKPLTYSGKLKESPALADLVRRGKLPPVEQRLPEHPYVVPHAWLVEGKYGGTMNWACADPTDQQTLTTIDESMYGHSPLRYLLDGQEIGPGIAETWEANAALTTWTFHFRKGLRWSDGVPFSVDDVLFWWEDQVLYPPMALVPPQELRSSSGGVPQLVKVDDMTLQIQYDAPTPLAADYAATWVKRQEGPRWVDPKHYMSQFHPKYNKHLNPTTWLTTFNNMQDWRNNPDNPVLTGWRVSARKVGQSVTLERNPYYYAIDRWGNQLPYMDGLTNTNLQDPQAMRLNIQQGKTDFAPGFLIGLTLSDVSTFENTKSQSGLDLKLWDSGSGTASMYFFNYDHEDPKLRSLFRNATFRQALSFAYNRQQAQKVIYYDQGQITTGTEGVKIIEFQVGEGPSIYKQWRDAFSAFNPSKAKQMLDSIGVKDVNGDGWREMPDGTALAITLDYPADTTEEHITKDQLLAADWKAIGINTTPNPVTPTSFALMWAAGQLQTTTAWEVSNAGSGLTYLDWEVPMENSRWAPLEGQWFLLQGTAQADGQSSVDPWKRTPPNLAPDVGGPVDRLQKLIRQAPAQKELMKRNQMVWEIFKIHIEEGPFYSGTVTDYPQLVLHKTGMRNVPARGDLALHGCTNPWGIPTPAVYDPETFFWEKPTSS